MSNQIVPLGYANTFGDWIVTTNKVLAETNDIGANNYIKDSGTFTINSSGTGLLVKNDAIVQGVLTVAGVGSSATVQNDLTVQRQLYLSNTGTSFLANGTANILGNLLVGGMIMPTFGSESNGISFLGGTTGDSANIKYYATAGDARKLHIQVTNDTSDDIYLDASGTVVIPNSRDSTSISSGAFVVTGGMGIGGDIYIGGTMKVQSTAEIQLGGKVNISNSMIVSANVDIGQRLTVSGNTTLGANLAVTGSAYFANTNESTSVSTGAIVTAGGVGIAKKLNVGGIINAKDTTESTSYNNGSLVVDGGLGVAKTLIAGTGIFSDGFISSSGPLYVNYAVESISDSTGSMQTKGGLGVAQRLNVTGSISSNGVIYANNTTDAASPIVGAVVVKGGLGVAKRIYSNGSISTDSFLNTGANATFFSVTDSSSVATGALVVGGGVGIGKKLYVGSDAVITGDITAETLTANKPVFTDANKKLTSAGVVGATQGGTGLSSFTNSGVVYASSTTALTTGGGLTYNGTDLTCGGNVTAYSDARLKKNIKVIENALEKVNKISGYTFERTDIDVGSQTGVIAQELINVLPEAVSTTHSGMYTVAYGNMVGLLVESIKELNSQVTSLKEEIEKLKNPS
jgi:acetyltransferase-like isoleucine patch superfamily enzyme